VKLEESLAMVHILEENLYSEEGEITQEAADMLDAWEAEVKKNADAIAYVIRRRQEESDLLAQEISRLQEHKNRSDQTAKYLSTRLKNALEARGIKKLDTPYNKISIINNGGVLPLLVDVPMEKLPEAYIKVKMVLSIDNEALRIACNAGTAPPGVRLGERGTRLAIK